VLQSLVVGVVPALTLVLTAGTISAAAPPAGAARPEASPAVAAPSPGPGTAAPASGGGPSPAAPAVTWEEGPPITLFWTAPEECPPLEALRAEISRVAGPIPAPAERPEARAVVHRGPKDTWQLELTTRVGSLSGERRLAAPSCLELMRAAALVLALMINPTASTAPPAAPRPPPPAVIVEAPSPPRETPPFFVGLDLAVGTGLLPGPAGGLELRFGWAHRHLQAELRAAAWGSKSAASPADPSTGGSFDLADVGGAACARVLPSRRATPSLCLGGLALRVHGLGSGVSDPGRATAWWPGAFAEASVYLHLTVRHGLRVAAEGIVPIGRPTFALAGVGSVWRPAAVAVRGMMGWEVHF
jgi:hypothetical protein